MLQKFNKIDTNLLNLILMDDIYKPKTNFINFNKKNQIKNIIEKEVKKADRIIIRSIGNFYTNYALKMCKKHNKKYLIEITGFAFDGLWYHSFLGKICAFPREIKLKISVKNAPYAVYVTKEALQQRYPCVGKSIGCSDVEINETDNFYLTRNHNVNNKKIILGTAAFIDVKWKGQSNVIKALYYLKKKGINNFEYQLIGAGKGEKLKKMIKKYGMSNQIKLLGVKKHEAVFDWLKTLDIYIQPSYQEGLCRSIVEAMSVGCPVICSNVGGNYELIDSNYTYDKRNFKELAAILRNISSDDLLNQSRKNHLKAQKYNSNILNKKRDKFYKEFCNNE